MQSPESASSLAGTATAAAAAPPAAPASQQRGRRTGAERALASGFDASDAVAAKRVAPTPPPSLPHDAMVGGAPGLAGGALHAPASQSRDPSPPLGFEQRLKDAVSQRRLARQKHRSRQQKPRAPAPSGGSPIEFEPAREGPVTTTTTTGRDSHALSRVKTTKQTSAASADEPLSNSPDNPEATQKTLKCVSFPLFERLLPARTASSPASGNGEAASSQETHTRQNENQRHVAASRWGWTRTRQQTTSSEAAGPADPGGAKRLSSAPISRHKNQSTSRRLNRLIRRSLAEITMLPEPRSMRYPRTLSQRGGLRAQSAYARPAQGGGGSATAIGSSSTRRLAINQRRCNTVRGTTEVTGNYASNICHHNSAMVAAAAAAAAAAATTTTSTTTNHRDQRKLVRPLVGTIEEEEEELREAEYAKNVDGGYAWVILAVVFIINASTFGTARAYGLIFDKLAREGDRTRTEAAMPFTIMGAIENMAGPLSGCMLALTQSWRITVLTGSVLITLAHLFAAIWADSQVGQFLSMGLMCGLGLSLVCISFFQVNNAYFVRYRNTAFGIGMTGAAFGTLIISPLCQYFLDNYEGTRMCYLMLSLIIAPNVPLALLLKPKIQPGPVGGPSSSSSSSISSSSDEDERRQGQLRSISERVDKRRRRDSTDVGIWTSVRLVISNPLFHLIWPTQLLFCWFNFVFGMIIVDFGKDRGLSAQDISHLVPCWAFGQLVGRLFLSSLVDLKFFTYRTFTVICFFAIGVTTLLLNNMRPPNSTASAITGTTNFDDEEGLQLSQQVDNTGFASLLVGPTPAPCPCGQHYLIILILVFVLSMFIALLYILLNGLVVNYVETSLQPLSIGISSFTGSFFLLPRANIIGYYRDTTGNYDAMLAMFTYVSLCAALVWLILPPLCKYLKDLSLRRNTWVK